MNNIPLQSFSISQPTIPDIENGLRVSTSPSSFENSGSRGANPLNSAGSRVALGSLPQRQSVAATIPNSRLASTNLPQRQSVAATAPNRQRTSEILGSVKKYCGWQALVPSIGGLIFTGGSVMVGLGIKNGVDFTAGKSVGSIAFNQAAIFTLMGGFSMVGGVMITGVGAFMCGTMRRQY